MRLWCSQTGFNFLSFRVLLQYSLLFCRFIMIIALVAYNMTMVKATLRLGVCLCSLFWTGTCIPTTNLNRTVQRNPAFRSMCPSQDLLIPKFLFYLGIRFCMNLLIRNMAKTFVRAFSELIRSWVHTLPILKIIPKIFAETSGNIRV